LSKKYNYSKREFNLFMLEIFQKSKARQNILKLFFANEEKSFYLSEIAKILKVSVGTTQRELNRLISSDILKIEKKANLNYYFLNKQNPLLKEIRSIFAKTLGIEVELKKIVKSVSGVKYALIFGSYVKGGFHADSDIDLLIIGRINEDELIGKIKILERTIQREINYHLYSEDDFKQKLKQKSFLQNILQNYLILTDNDYEFRKLFKRFG